MFIPPEELKESDSSIFHQGKRRFAPIGAFRSPKIIGLPCAVRGEQNICHRRGR